MINHLISLPLKGIDYSDDYDDKMAFIERIESENPLCVIRTMVKDNINKTMVDGARIYVSKKEVIACRPDNNGNFVQMMLKINAVNWNFSLLSLMKVLCMEQNLNILVLLLIKFLKMFKLSFYGVF